MNQLTTKKDIQNWLNEMNITDYTINEDLTVDVNGSVDLKAKGFTSIPIQFGMVKGIFQCSNNRLKTLEGTPHTVDGIFKCDFNKLENLVGGPKIATYAYECENNNLSSLLGSPDKTRYFNCSNNKLTDLSNGPIEVESYICHNNPIQITKMINTQITRSFDHANKDGSCIEIFKDYYEHSYNFETKESIFLLHLSTKDFFEKLNKALIIFEKEQLENKVEISLNNKKIKL
jgi:hypothetical protein